MTTKTQTDDGLAILIGIFLNHHFYTELIEDISEIIFELIKEHEDSLMVIKNGRHGFNVPYHKISEGIFDHQDKIEFESLENFVSAVNSFLIVSKEDRFVVCFNKLSRHILLSVRQKSFINEVTNDAKRAATQATDEANRAKKLAEETEKEIKNSAANYITILGIFATIIFALFGGVNLISAVNNLLASEHRPRLATLTLLMSLLVLAITTMLVMLMSWLSEIRGLGDPKWTERLYLKVYFGMVIVCLVIMAISSIKLFI